MRVHIWIMLGVALLAGACSSKTPNPSATGSPSPTPVVSPTASATKKPVHVASARSAVYSYKNAIWLYDVKTNATRQITQGGTAILPRWVSATSISFVEVSNDGMQGTVRMLDLKTSKATDLFSESNGINAYAWSPDRQTIAYVTTDAEGYPHVRFRSISDGSTQSVATLARVPGRGATASDEIRVEFSKDGQFVLVVDTAAEGMEESVPKEQSRLQVRALDGSLAFAADPARDPTMGLWLPDGKTLLYRDSGGIRSWTPATGKSHVVRNGLRWFDPSPSRDGRLVAFDSGADSPDVVVRVLTLQTAKYDTLSAKGRAYPVFAAPHTIWAQQVRKCFPCESPTEPIPHVIAIDTRNGKETALPIQGLLDVDVFYV